MYIYRALDDGNAHRQRPDDENGDQANMQIIEVDGKPAPLVGIRFSARDFNVEDDNKGSDQPIDPYQAAPGTDLQYWADHDKSTRTVWAEDFKVTMVVLATPRCGQQSILLKPRGGSPHS